MTDPAATPLPPPPRARYCADCRARIPGGAAYCAGCGGEPGWLLAPADEVIEDAGLPWPLSLLGAWPEGDRLLLHGARGAGKSTIAFSVAGWALSRARPAIWASTEQTPAQVSRYARRCLGDIWCDLRLLDHPGGDELLSLIRGGAVAGGVLILDSLQGLCDWAAQSAWVRASQDAAAEGRARLVIIGQHKGGGGAAGEGAVPHDVDAVAEITVDAGARLISVDKNRNGPTGRSYFDLGPNGATLPDLSHAAWSVEGEGEELRLVAYPPASKRDAKWADLLRALERRGLLQAGDAAAARGASYAPHGYLLPGDWRLRQAFAERHGLRWRSPEELEEVNGEQ